MNHNPELESLIHGALDHALTAEEQERLARFIRESPDARARAAELEQLATVIESLGQADAPRGLAAHVLAEVSHRPQALPQSTFPRGVAVNKKLLFGLAAAAAIVLAVITYNSNPPATVGTEATIGTAQRAQTPQIASKDVKLGDTSAQDVLQTDTFDAIMKDETLRSSLQDAEIRQQLHNADLRKSLEDENVRKALNDPAIAKKIQDAAMVRALSDEAAMKKLDDANMRWLVNNKAFAAALRHDGFRVALSRPGVAAALAGRAMQQALRDNGFEAALKSDAFMARLRTGARVQ
jgi:hypothetical protein